MIDIILKFPKSTIYFFRFSRQYVNKAVYRHIMTMVLAIILLRGHRTYANASRLFFDGRHKSSISRCFKDAVFPGFTLQEDMGKRLLREALKIPVAKRGTKRKIYIIIDGTAQKKRGKKMENKIVYKKGYTSDHLFVMGLLYLPDTWVRIPLPRRLYRTKKYCKEHGYKYRSQIKIAEQMIKYASLPDDVDVTVIFDSFFPSEGVIKMIRHKGYHFVCSVKGNRVYRDKQLKEICQEHISEGLIKNRIEIKVSSNRSRYNHPSADKYETKVFITYTEKLVISKMGEVLAVFSRKEDEKSELKNMRYIVTDRIDIDTEEILTIYSYRWQIELFFKELKSYLGLGNYQMLSFVAIVRHVDCVIMSFMYLEYLRICKLQEEPTSKQWRYSRTLQMSYVVQHEVRMTNIAYLKRIIKDESSFVKLEQKLMEKLPLVA
jgi:Transposase DDE domain